MVSTEFDVALRKVRSAVTQSGPNAVRELDKALAELVSRPTPAYIVPLLLLLDDEAAHDEAMFSLIHAAEAFDDAEYVPELLEALPTLRSNAPKWASIVLTRTLNSGPTRELLVRVVREASQQSKEAILWLCQRIDERSSSFRDRTAAVAVAAQSK